MPKLRFTVHAGPHARRECPVLARLPHSGKKPPISVLLTAEDGSSLPCQVALPAFGRGAAPSDHFCIAFVLPKLDAGRSATFVVEPTDEPAAAAAVTVADDRSGRADIAVNGGPLTTYRYLGNPARPCFFPLIGPSGTRVTRSWPVADDVPAETKDHHHHRSLWVAHGDVNGTDNWSEGEGHGFQIHREIIVAESGVVYGQLAALTDWTDKNQRKILEEKRALTAWAIGDARFFDFDVCFTATECDVRFGDTKEGGILALRVAPAMDGDHGGRIENSYGAVGENECWGRRAQWCDYVGEIEGDRLGIAIFDHPRSFRHPTYWHVRDYGMYTANPFGLHDFHDDPSIDGGHLLQRGASLNFHYRVYLHRGSAADAGVAARYHDYANPPRVETAS
ncbi:MAG: PmoA family protein [Armatimonadota bacterium]|jgi:hypothetical protein